MPTAAWFKKRYKMNKEKGICVTCIQVPARPGLATCQSCNDRSVLKQKNNPTAHLTATRKHKVKLKTQVLEKLGAVCANPGCRWLNEDGTLGCRLTAILQIDHVGGGGVQEHRALKHNYQKFLRLVLADEAGKYQLLCPNCNWWKRYKEEEHRRTIVNLPH